jgi:hypothetical protein
MTAAINASDAAIETVPRDKFWYDPNIGEPFDFNRVDMATGDKTLLQLGLADAAIGADAGRPRGGKGSKRPRSRRPRSADLIFPLV